MRVGKERLYNKTQTARGMYDLINRYYKDLKNYTIRRTGRLVPLTSLTIEEFFYFVRSIPYRKDISPVEVIARPRHIIRGRMSGLDCKKKAILMGSFLKGKGIKYRLMSSSRKPNGKIHHVFPQVKTSNGYLNLDATYSHYLPLQPKLVTNSEVL